MKRIARCALLGLILCTGAVQAQTEDCGCREEFDFVVRYLEANLPAFHQDVTADNRAAYTDFRDALRQKASQATDRNACFRYLTQYVEFFQDNHTKMRNRGTVTVDESDPTNLAEFRNGSLYRDTETLPLPDDSVLTDFPLTDIRGVYVSTDSQYTVAVIDAQTEFRDYAGVILDARNELWTPGQVKFELKRKDSRTVEGFLYDRYHRAEYLTAVGFGAGFLGEHWVKRERADKVNHSLNPERAFTYRVADSTVILRVPSFMSSHTRTLDSLYHAAADEIGRHPYLLIDVRDNGGGNSSNFSALLPYLYTRPIVNDETVELYATEDIIALYQADFDRIMQDSSQVNTETIAAFREGLAAMRAAEPNTFVREEYSDTLVLPVLDTPRRVGILYNKGCASACEDLLFTARQSDKTVLLGDNSGGFVGYGNMFTVYTPCNGFGLSMSTSRYGTQWKYEVVGIAPDYRLDYDRDWIGQAIRVLRRTGRDNGND
ncbi:S41 family peptidase [Lewinella sp. IMCC34191]|uniref:S41 family peptidase n=1 Tax=Lewinella sp. IMCC34191 TaxID=2259172 RepID=UPI000E27370B|nr:S41 family peptidase [Lewinella sp. IMCC34191]